MSVEFYLACTKHKELIHIGQDGLSGFAFYSGIPECMKALRYFLDEHKFSCPLILMTDPYHLMPPEEYEKQDDDYEEPSKEEWENFYKVWKWE